MSRKAVIDLFKASAEDRTLHTQLETADNIASIVRLARDKGYEFNEAEYTAVVKEMMAKNNGEIDDSVEDSELETVAGGSEGWAEKQQQMIDKYGYDGG